MKIEVSHGEILDKISILEIKLDRIEDIDKLGNIKKEIFELRKHKQSILNFLKHSGNYEKYLELYEVNLKLWDIEDKIRLKEKLKEFDEEFIEIARSVYKINDRRSVLKKEINIVLNSKIIEEKSY